MTTEFWLENYVPDADTRYLADGLIVELRKQGYPMPDWRDFNRPISSLAGYWLLEPGNNVWAQDGAAHDRPGWVRFWCRYPEDAPILRAIAEEWERAAKRWKELHQS